MKIPRDERGKFQTRTLNSLKADHLRFETEGEGKLKEAKFYNNVISSYFFDIPLTQVSLCNSLHVSFLC